MRVTNNTYTTNLTSRLMQLGEQQAELQKQVSTGQRVHKASDDPSAVGQVLELQSEKREMVQFKRNHDRASNILEVSFSNLDNMRQVLVRAQEVALSSNSLTAPEDFRAHASQIDSLLERMLETANAKFKGEYLFGGDKLTETPFNATRDVDGKVTALAYEGSGDGPEFYVGEGTKLSPYNKSSDNADFAGLMNNLVALRDALTANDLSGVETARGTLADAEDDVIASIGENGAAQTRLEVAAARDVERYRQLDEGVSERVDVDLASVILKLNQSQTAYQAALQTGSKIMRQTLLDLI